jgi:hypothetical protein
MAMAVGIDGTLVAQVASHDYRLINCPSPKDTSQEYRIFLLHPNHPNQTGLPDFPWYMIPKPDKMYQRNTKCTR